MHTLCDYTKTRSHDKVIASSSLGKTDEKPLASQVWVFESKVGETAHFIFEVGKRTRNITIIA